MVDATWSIHGADECLRVRGLDPGAHLAVWPTTTMVVAGSTASMAGRLVPAGDGVCFVPRFAFVGGTSYTVVAEGSPPIELVRPRAVREPSTVVVAIRPDVAEVPRNLLRISIEFSAPMSEGQMATHLRLVDDAGRLLESALLAVDDELWDRDRRWLSVLLDPARLKRGLVAHRTFGYPLRTNEPFRVEVAGGALDATGTPMTRSASRRYLVGPDERRRIDSDLWTVIVPPVGSLEPLLVEFDRALDERLVGRYLEVVDVDDRRLDGAARAGRGSRAWSFQPAHQWVDGPHRLVLDGRLEDLAGNSVARAFDRDLSDVDGVADPIGVGRGADRQIIGFRPAGAGRDGRAS